jgi:ABC-type uncharacterized transport system ATPase subunit
MIEFITYEDKVQELEYFNKIMQYTDKYKIGIISARLPLIANLAVAENIMLPISYHKNIRLKELEPKVLERLKKYDMQDILYYRKNQLNVFEEFVTKYLMASFLEADFIVFFSTLKYMHGKDRIKFFDLLLKENNNENFVVIEYNEYANLVFSKIKAEEIDFKKWVTQNLEA